MLWVAAVAWSLTPAQLDRAAAADPPVVVLGNSKVATDLDAGVLSAALGREVLAVSIPGTAAPVWYAAYTQHLAPNGATPELLVVYGTTLAMATDTLPQDPARAVLASWAPVPDPLLDAAQGAPAGAPPDPAEREHWRRLLLPACHPEREGPLPAEGRPATDGQVLTALIARARAGGAEVVVVPAPVAAAERRRLDHPAPDTLAGLVRAAGAAWSAPVDAPAAWFGDGVHATQAGRAALTRRLAALLRAEPWTAPAVPAPGQDLLPGLTYRPPPPLPALPAVPVPVPSGVPAARVALPGALPGQAATSAAVGFACTPLTLPPFQLLRREDDVLVSDPACAPVPADLPALGLAADRRCGDARWLYPGDVAEVVLPDGPRTLVLAGGVPGTADGALELQLVGRAWRRVVPTATLRASVATVRLPAGRDRTLRLALRGAKEDPLSDDAPWLLVTSAYLVP